MDDIKYGKLKQPEAPEGCDIVERKSNVLQLDFDSSVVPGDFNEKLALLKKNKFNVVAGRRWTSRNGYTHVELKMDTDISNKTAIILQMFLGSDPVRELLSCRRVEEGIYPVSLLYKPKGSKASALDVATWDD